MMFSVLLPRHKEIHSKLWKTRKPHLPQKVLEVDALNLTNTR